MIYLLLSTFVASTIYALFELMKFNTPTTAIEDLDLTVPTAKGYYVGFGLNNIDPAVYGDSGELNGCVNDIKEGYEFFKAKNYESVAYYNEKATVQQFVSSMDDLIRKVKKGDNVVIQMSRHGSTLPGSMDQDEIQDQCAVMYDGLIVDDCFLRIFKLLPECKLIYINDSCHSATQFKVFQPGFAFKHTARSKDVSKVPKSKYLDINKLNQLFPANPTILSCSLISIAGCLDTESSLDVFINDVPRGAMTYTLFKIIKEQPDIKLVDLEGKLRSQIEFNQTPTVVFEGSTVYHNTSFA
jgi:Caspase domain